MKRVLSLLLAIVMVFGLIPMAAFAEGNPTISFETTFVDTMTVGDTFKVTANLANNELFTTMTLSLKWNEDAVKFTGFDVTNRGALDTEVYTYSAPIINQEEGIVTGADAYGYDTNGKIFTANFEIIGSGDLEIGLKNADATEFEMANGETDIAVTVDYSAIENLSVAGAEPEGPAIPDGAPFTAITTDAGAAIAIEQQEDVSFNGGDVPYYIVTIPADATTAYVTAPGQVVMEDYNTGAMQATGYAAEVGNGWNPLYISYNYEDTADGPKVEIPMNMVATDWSGEVELCFVEDEDGNLSHAFGIEDSKYACLGLISFRYGTSSAPEEPEEPTVSEIPAGAAFVDMIARVNGEDKPVTIQVMDDHYKVLVPLGTTAVYVVYDEGVPYVDNFGYAAVRITGVDGVSDDGYSQSTSDGKTTVGLLMKKAPANGAPTTIELISLDYANRTAVGIKKADNSAEDWFSFTYQLSEGEHYAILPEGIGYTASGSPVAKNGYTFSVTIDEGYEATADFAVKVNGTTVATEPGEITVDSVTQDLFITVAGVQKIVEATDISVTFDLTGYLGAFSGGMNYVTQSYEMVELTPEVNKKNTLTLKASDNMILQAQAYNYSSLVTGWDIDGTIYNIPTEYTRMSLGDGIELALNTDGYFSLNVETTSPYTAVIKPVLVAIPEGNYHVFLPDADDAYTLTAETYATDGYTFSVAISHGYRATDAFAVKVNGETVATAPGTITLDTVSQNLAITVEGIEMLTYTIDSGFPAFVEDIIKVTNIVVEKEGVESYQWDGDTLTVILSDETAQNASITTNWTIYAKNTYDGATGARFKFNGSNKAISGAEGTGAFPVTTTLVDGAATAEITVEPRNTVQTNRDIIFTPKTFTVNFYVSGKEPAPEPTTYTITAQQPTGGTVTVLDQDGNEITQAAEGDAIFLQNEAAEGYRFKHYLINGTVVTEDTLGMNNGFYLMPAENITVTALFESTAEGYFFATSADVSTENGGTAVVSVKITGHSDENVTGYNAYDVTLTFDTDKLEPATDAEGNCIYSGAVKTDNGSVTVNGNTIRIVGCGADKAFGTEIAALTFKTKAEGNANVTISKVQVSDKNESVKEDAPVATPKHDENDTTADTTPDQSVVQVPYTVSKPDFVSGDTSVLHGEDYTFSYKDTDNYTYTGLTVTVGGEGVTPTVADGVYTIANVTGAVTIEVTQTANSYTVTKPTNVTGPDKATYGEDYIFTVTPSEGKVIDTVTVTTANGSAIPYTINENGEYVIEGTDISGPFSITVTENDKPVATTTITFTGVDEEEVDGGLTQTAPIGKEFTFQLNKDEKFTYTAKVGETVLTETEGKYTIPAELVVEGGVTVTITKEEIKNLTVEVNEYISLDGKVMFLVTAKWDDKVLSYGEGNTMFWSSKYTVTGETEAGAYSWLVVSTDEMNTVDAVKSAAETAIVEAAAGTTAAAIGYDYDINETTKVDVNDAQLAYDMYNASYMEFTDNLPMLKFLEADMETDGKLDTKDVAAIISHIVNGAAN